MWLIELLMIWSRLAWMSGRRLLLFLATLGRLWSIRQLLKRFLRSPAPTRTTRAAFSGTVDATSTVLKQELADTAAVAEAASHTRDDCSDEHLVDRAGDDAKRLSFFGTPLVV